MAATTTTETMISRAKPPRTTKLVCFSYAAYAKNLIDHLKSLNIPILPGLNDAEFSDIESTFNFTFPPDLRSILREGLPAGPAFPNWLSSSHQQLRILVNLPVLSLSKNVSLNNFWSVSWGQRPQNNNDALSLIKKLLDKAPLLVPIYRNCYVPSTPNMAGNPVFYIDTEEVRVLSFDLAGFFKQVDEFVKAGGGGGVLDMPAWAAKEPRTIEFWTDVAERGRRVLARGGSRGRWWRAGCENTRVGLECCMDEVFWRLRDGGWREEEVREMMMVVDGHDDPTSEVQLVGDSTGRGSVERHVRLLSLVLLRAGWSKEDVVYSLNLQDHGSFNGLDSKEGKSNKPQHPRKCSKNNSPAAQEKCITRLLLYHFGVNLPVMIFSYPVFKYMGMQSSLPLPSWKVVLSQIIFYFILEDFVFYWGHRILHTKWLYKHVHSVHHEYATPFGLTSEYAHPAEILFLGFATIVGPAITGPHLMTLWLWMVLRVLETVEAHCGYHFPWSLSNFIPLYGGADFHDYHHRLLYTKSGNYSSTFVYMDWIFGTDKGYRKLKALKSFGIEDDPKQM